MHLLRTVGTPHSEIFCNGAVYGTVVVSRLHPNCGTGNEPVLVHRIASAMVWSTWIFSVILWCASFSPRISYHACPSFGAHLGLLLLELLLVVVTCLNAMSVSHSGAAIYCCCSSCTVFACVKQSGALQHDHLCGVQCVLCSDKDRDVGEAALMHQLDVWLLQDDDAASRWQARKPTSSQRAYLAHTSAPSAGCFVGPRT